MDEDDDLFSNHDSDSGDFMNMDWAKVRFPFMFFFSLNLFWPCFLVCVGGGGVGANANF